VHWWLPRPAEILTTRSKNARNQVDVHGGEVGVVRMNTASLTEGPTCLWAQRHEHTSMRPSSGPHLLAWWRVRTGASEVAGVRSSSARSARAMEGITPTTGPHMQVNRHAWRGKGDRPGGPHVSRLREGKGKWAKCADWGPIRYSFFLSFLLFPPLFSFKFKLQIWICMYEVQT
jgi:hypothetical protein